MLLKTVGVALLAILIFTSFQLLVGLGYFQHHFKHHPGICRHVKGLNFGSEDFQILSNGLTFVTSGFVYAPLGQNYRDFMKENDVKGRIYAVDLTKAHTEAKEVQIKSSKDFNLSSFAPHGISVLEDGVKGQHLLYVVNHNGDIDDRVEKFRYLPDKSELVHMKSFVSEQFQLINDLALTGEDTFYISNYLFYKDSFMSLIEQTLALKLGGLLYFNGHKFTPQAQGLAGPNGVLLSEDKRYLYVAMQHLQEIKVYEVQPDNSLRAIQELNVHTSIDNLHLSQDGRSLYGGCDPIAFKTLQHLENPNIKAPSQVIHLPLKDGKIIEDGISESFYDHGDLISGSTIASIYRKKFLIGSIINKLVVCDLA